MRHVSRTADTPNGAAPRVTHLRAEYRANQVVAAGCPRLSWIVADTDSWVQERYEVAAQDESAAVYSSESVLVPWPLRPLVSRERRRIRVRATSADGRTTQWSDELCVEAALLDDADWVASFVGPSEACVPLVDSACSYLRREFVISKPVDTARLYMTALGVYEPHLNGAVVGDEVLPPGWTSYHKRLRVQTYDVAECLQQGANTVGAVLGDGWFRGRLAFRFRGEEIGEGPKNIYGDALGILAQLEITYRDGTTQRVVSDEAWRWSYGPVVASGLYDGERYEARLELDGWDLPGYDDSPWRDVRPVSYPLTTLVFPPDPPIRRIEELPVISVSPSPSGKVIVDFGQNLVGRLRIRVRGSGGETVTLRHAEVLYQGELATEPLRTARATDTYTASGRGVEVWEPLFTFHGFRYAEVDGWPTGIDRDDIVAVVIHTDLQRTGYFECSDPLLNQLHENAVWSMRGNFVGVPTDCPQRDERLGWTGDLQVFAPAACVLYNVNGALVSWLADLAADQEPSGRVPWIAPNINAALSNKDPCRAVAGWSDAAVIVPWVLYQYYGDVDVLRTQYDSMRSWVHYLVSRTGESHLWIGDFQFADHLAPGPRTDPDLIATAYFARSTSLLAAAAHVLGRADDHERYARLVDQIKSAFQRTFITPAGLPTSDTQTACCLALEFDLLPDAEARRRTAQRLVELVEQADFRIQTGFLGTPLICDALSNAGYEDVAYRLLLQRKCPSWLYPITAGATTIWERWDSLRPDGTLNDSRMTSFNHYALGAVVSWMHRTVGGLAPLSPGFRRALIRPRPRGGLTSARIEHQTPYGRADVSWEIHNRELVVHAAVPANTSALVDLPGGKKPFEVQSGSYRWTVPSPSL
jgi:alpha-L-rhamnosidase